MTDINIQPLDDADKLWVSQRLLEWGGADSVSSFAELDGYLTAVYSGPDLANTSDWWDGLWGVDLPRVEDEADFRRFLDCLHRHIKWVNFSLLDQPEHFAPAFEPGECIHGLPLARVDRWCRGYLRGVYVANWPPLPDGVQKHLDLITLHGGVEHTELFSALQADEYAQSIDMLPHAALLLHTWWLMKLSCEPHLANGKVGRNQPCPCGSGKKYKQCCLRGQQ